LYFESEKRIGSTLKKGLIYTIIICFLLLGCPLSGTTVTAQELLGDVSDGSQSVYVHLIRLYDGEGTAIAADDEPAQPFSPRQTCGKCHSYETISKGWHFNAADPNVVPGRPGQPWIFVDASVGIQIPLSYRAWAGTFRPEQLGITPFEFTKLFGRHMPGGGVGELDSDEAMRQFVSGKLEINCLGCHNAHPGQDQGGIFGYASQIAQQNFRWAAAASSEFASVSGSAAAQPDTYDPLMSDAVATKYRANTFDDTNRVLFSIVRKVANERCYFCHSNVNVERHGSEKWTADEDIHLTAGMTCVDCHRNGLGHNITRGYEGEDEVSENLLAGTSTCEGCHLGTGSSVPEAGRLGAPVPEHPGIPPVHFEKLTCTACHSGPWPAQKTYRCKTSQAHALGTHGANKSPDALPHLMFPVLAKQPNGKIASHKLIWPAFWGTLKDEKVTAITLETVRQVVGGVTGGERLPPSGDWPDLTEAHIAKALGSLQESVEGTVVYICGGKLYQLDDSGQLSKEEHTVAEPYLWPFAHNVRPAAQSLGIRHCEDCHATDGPFFFGKVAVDSPLVSERRAVRTMIEFQGIDTFYAWAFAFSFVFRPWLKIVALGSCAFLAGVLLLYALKALACVAKVLVGND